MYLITIYFYAGLVDSSELLANIETQIIKAKEESIIRRDIMDRIDKWLAVCEEENWLEDYNQVVFSRSCDPPIS